MAEGNPRQSGWNVDTLHAHLDSKIAELTRHINDKFAEADKRYEQRFQAAQTEMAGALTAQEKAVSVAESVAEKWRINANEWRSTLADRDKKFMLEETARAEMKSHEARLKNLEEHVSKDEWRKRGMGDLIGWIAGAIGVGVAIATLIFKK